MKNLLFIAFLFLLHFFSFAQKYDANRVMGTYEQGMILSFQDTGLAITTSSLPTGIYLLNYRFEQQNPQKLKIVVVH